MRTPLQLKTTMFLRIAARQKNRENYRPADGADVNEHQGKSTNSAPRGRRGYARPSNETKENAACMRFGNVAAASAAASVKTAMMR